MKELISILGPILAWAYWNWRRGRRRDGER